MAVPIAKNLGLTVITNGSAANAERVLRLGADRFIDYKTEDYSRVLSDMDMVLDTLGDKELPKKFGILKNGGHLVSLRAMPNKAFAIRSGMPLMKRLLFAAAGRKVNQMAARKNQTYDLFSSMKTARVLSGFLPSSAKSTLRPRSMRCSPSRIPQKPCKRWPLGNPGERPLSGSDTTTGMPGIGSAAQ